MRRLSVSLGAIAGPRLSTNRATNWNLFTYGLACCILGSGLIPGSVGVVIGSGAAIVSGLFLGGSVGAAFTVGSDSIVCAVGIVNSWIGSGIINGIVGGLFLGGLLIVTTEKAFEEVDDFIPPAVAISAFGCILDGIQGAVDHGVVA